MLKKTKMLHLLHLFLPLCIVAEVHASTRDVHDIIDICTSSERIMKDYALIGMKITHHNPQKDLNETTKHLDIEMSDLLQHKLEIVLQREEKELQKEWMQMEEELKRTPSKEKALMLHHHINTFAQHCEVLAEHLAKDTGNAAEHYVVEIARLNLNVQELTGLYVMKSWGTVEDKEYFEEVKNILEDYNKTYQDILSADKKFVSDKVKEKLKVLKKHFMVFEVMAESRSGTFVPRLISKKADMIQKETEEILAEEEEEQEK